jgi:ribosomal protein L11 methyltransferase
VETAVINCRLNDLDGRITHITGILDAVMERDFDIVLANIYGDILLDLAEALCVKLKPGGTLLLSGILWEYNFDVRQAYEKSGCEVIHNRMLEEFSTVLMHKK